MPRSGKKVSTGRRARVSAPVAPCFGTIDGAGMGTSTCSVRTQPILGTARALILATFSQSHREPLRNHHLRRLEQSSAIVKGGKCE